jgi:hypothetical protein
MTAYATVAQLRAILGQVGATADVTSRLQEELDWATDLVRYELGFDFAGYAEAATARRFNGGGGQLLHLPCHQVGTLTALYPVCSDLSLGTAFVAGLDYEVDADDHTYLFMPGGWWIGRYEATAQWGYGAAPSQIVKVVLELAVNSWRSGSRGMFSDAVGAEGGGVVSPGRYLNWGQRDAITQVRRQYGNLGFA